MGREIRRVPPDWVHPVYTEEEVWDYRRIGKPKPLNDESFEEACEKWIAGFYQWQAKTHEEYDPEWQYWEHCKTPDRDLYRTRRWTAEEATHYQVYETVSEGTPITPVFATKEELLEYLVSVGDTFRQASYARGYAKSPVWDRKAAEDFIEHEYCCGGVSHGNGFLLPGDSELVSDKE